MKKMLLLMVIIAGGVTWFLLQPENLKSNVPYKLVFREKITGNVTGPAAEAALPMAIVFHGSGTSEKSMLSLFSELKLPMRVIAFRGPSSSPAGGYDWPLEDPRLLDSIAVGVGELALRYPTVGKPILYGHSSGGDLVYRLMAARHELFSGIFIAGAAASLSLTDLKFARISADLPVHVYHGQNDELFPISPMRAFVADLKASGIKATWHEYEGGHVVPYSLQAIIRSDIGGLLNFP